MISPEKMCRKHLLGEHVELHMLVGSINKDKLNSVIGLCKKGFLEPTKIQHRHKELVREMEKRGYNHRSPLPDFSLPKELKKEKYEVDPEKSRQDLKKRCPNFKTKLKR